MTALSTILEEDEDVPFDKNEDVLLGDDSSKKAISYKLAQAFYNEITGKSERLTEAFLSSFVLSMDNIIQLHDLIVQSTTQYNVATANASFSVSYLKGSSDRFSSIDRFKTHVGTKAFPVEEISINYNK